MFIQKSICNPLCRLIPEKTAGLVNETLLISTNQKLACPDRAGKLLIGVLVRESVCCVTQNKHPEELEAEDFTDVSPLEFKLASAIKIYNYF